jgi:hypothetical protein
MAKKLGVLIIHGMGSQVEGFECDLVKELIARVDGDANDVAWQGVYWQDITEPREREYLEKAGEMVDLDWDKARGFMAAAFGDAAAYQFTGTGGTYGRIHDRIRARMHDLYVNKLESTDVPLLVLAHSLGGHMMSNYIWDMQPNLKGEVRANGVRASLRSSARKPLQVSSPSAATSLYSRSPTTTRGRSRSLAQRSLPRTQKGQRGSTTTTRTTSSVGRFSR